MRWAAFVRAATRYWTRVFPTVARELHRRRAMALEIPDPVLRRLALQALECKRCNLEGAAAFELLARGHNRRSLMRTLTSFQTMCDYLDLLAEQPTRDPIANGRSLHQALSVALAPGVQHRDYYAHHISGEDGGYLRTLVEEIQTGLSKLPAFERIGQPLRRCTERISAYQSFNHGDARGSYEQFERWASRQVPPDSALSWWEAGGAGGSTLIVFALICSATDRRLGEGTVQALQRAYFPWIGALHSLLDSLVDQHEDTSSGERGLIGCYPSPERSTARMCAIYAQSLRRARELPRGRSHGLLVVAMTGFYLCEALQLQDSPYARTVVPELRRAVGRLGGAAMLMMRLRHSARRQSPQAHPPLSPPSSVEAPTDALDPCPAAECGGCE